MRLRSFVPVLVGACLICTVPCASAAAQPCATVAADTQAASSRKKGPGLRGLLAAAKRAGVGDLLGSGHLLGDSRTAQVASAVVGTAVETSDGAEGIRALGSAAAARAGDARTAQVAGAVTAMASELARDGASGAGEAVETCSPASVAPPAAPAAVWN